MLQGQGEPRLRRQIRSDEIPDGLVRRLTIMAGAGREAGAGVDLQGARLNLVQRLIQRRGSLRGDFRRTDEGVCGAGLFDHISRDCGGAPRQPGQKGEPRLHGRQSTLIALVTDTS